MRRGGQGRPHRGWRRWVPMGRGAWVLYLRSSGIRARARATASTRRRAARAPGGSRREASAGRPRPRRGGPGSRTPPAWRRLRATRCRGDPSTPWNVRVRIGGQRFGQPAERSVARSRGEVRPPDAAVIDFVLEQRLDGLARDGVGRPREHLGEVDARSASRSCSTSRRRGRAPGLAGVAAGCIGTFGSPRKRAGTRSAPRSADGEAAADLRVPYLVARRARHQREHDGFAALLGELPREQRERPDREVLLLHALEPRRADRAPTVFAEHLGAEVIPGDGPPRTATCGFEGCDVAHGEAVS